MARTIQCEKCAKPLGELRDATLRKGVVFMCAECDARTKVSNLERGFSEIHDMLKGFRKS